MAPRLPHLAFEVRVLLLLAFVVASTQVFALAGSATVGAALLRWLGPPLVAAATAAALDTAAAAAEGAASSRKVVPARATAAARTLGADADESYGLFTGEPTVYPSPGSPAGGPAPTAAPPEDAYLDMCAAANTALGELLRAAEPGPRRLALLRRLERTHRIRWVTADASARRMRFGSRSRQSSLASGHAALGGGSLAAPPGGGSPLAVPIALRGSAQRLSGGGDSVRGGIGGIGGIGGGDGDDDGDSVLALDAMATAVCTMALRYPASAQPLAVSRNPTDLGGFAWGRPAPLLVQGPSGARHALRAWADGAEGGEAVEVFPAQGGLWHSSRAERVLGALSLCCALLAVEGCGRGVEAGATSALLGVASYAALAAGAAAAGALLVLARRRTGNVAAARWSLAAGAAAGALGCCWDARDAAAAAPAGESAPWQRVAAPALQALSCLPLLAVALLLPPSASSAKAAAWPLSLSLSFSLCPHYYYSHDVLLFGAFPALLWAAAAPYVLGGDFAAWHVHAAPGTLLASAVLGVGMLLRRGAARAARRVARRGEADAARFARVWEGQLLHAREALASLAGAWGELQARARARARAQGQEQGQAPALRRQESAPDFHGLLLQAVALNDVFGAKMHALAAATGGMFRGCATKDDRRSVQKVQRCLGGDWRRLCDVVRCRLVFATVAGVEAVLRAIAADAELEVVVADGDDDDGDGDDAQMRLRESYDAAALSSGYRDVRLCCRLNSTEARRRGVHGHVAEVQIHLGALLALQTDESHANCIKQRNLQVHLRPPSKKRRRPPE